MKKLLLAATTAAMMTGAGVASAVEISGNVALTTDYKFRGISQSSEEAAIQGGFDLGFDNGFYIGTWGSTVDFDLAESGSMELDYYAGWGGDLTESISVDVGYMVYTYPGTDIDEGYEEVYASVSFADFTLGTAISGDYYAETGDFYYVYAQYGFVIGDGWGIDLHVGMNEFDEVSFLSDGADSYIDYSVGVSKDYAGVTWGLAYVGTDLDESEVFDTEWGEDSVIFTISKSL
ncbi:MAG: hypothetical protein ACJAQS_000362 [Porticoccus sp.]|jgi:uncharacterized protein (TIGR02001 family)